MDLLNGEPVICLSGEEFLPKEGMTFIEQVSDFFSKQGGVANSPFGEVTLDKKGIKNDMAHGIGRLKACSFAAIKDVLENGVVINPMKQYHTNQKKNPTGMIAAPIMIGDEKYVCVVEVIANRQINRLYVHEVTLTKNLQGDVADSNAVHRDNNLVTHPQGEIAKVLQNYITANKSQENNSETNENKQYKTRYNMKKTIRLSEDDLHKIVNESVSSLLNEYNDDKEYYNILGLITEVEKSAMNVYHAAKNTRWEWLQRYAFEIVQNCKTQHGLMESDRKNRSSFDIPGYGY